MTPPARRWRPGATYAALVVAGLALNELLAPRLLAGAGASLPADLLQRWTSASRALLLALAAFGCLHVSIDRWTTAHPPHNPDVAHRWQRVFLACSALFLAATVLAGSHGDYGTFRQIWAVVLSGGDPWWGRPLNAYGPAFNALALLTVPTPLAPKVLCAFAYLMLVAWLAAVVAPRRGAPDAIWPLAVVAVMNPFAWIEQVHWGNFDVLVAITCVAAIDARTRGRDLTAGSWLAGGIALKFFPALLAPALALDRGRPRVRLVAVCVSLLLLAFGASLLLWGSATARPLLFAGSRQSVNSIFSFLRGPLSPLRLVWDSPNVDWLSTPLLVGTMLVVTIWCVREEVSPSRAGLASVVAGLLFYRTGLSRYQVILAAVLAYWALTEPLPLKSRRAMLTWLAVYAAWITYFDVAAWLSAVTSVGTQERYALVRAMVMVAGRAWGPMIFALELSLLFWLMKSRAGDGMAEGLAE